MAGRYPICSIAHGQAIKTFYVYGCVCACKPKILRCKDVRCTQVSISDTRHSSFLRPGIFQACTPLHAEFPAVPSTPLPRSRRAPATLSLSFGRGVCRILAAIERAGRADGAASWARHPGAAGAIIIMHARRADIVLAVRVAQRAAVSVTGTCRVVLPAPVARAARAVSANGLRISGLAAVAVDV